MAGSYTADEQGAAALLSEFTTTSGSKNFILGAKTKTTSSTTLVVAHGLGATPTFCLFSNYQTGALATTQPVMTLNTTSITFTLATAQATWTISYFAGILS